MRSKPVFGTNINHFAKNKSIHEYFNKYICSRNKLFYSSLKYFFDN
jgi:hypothetical protein